MAELDGCGEPETVPVVVNFSAAISPPTNIHHKWHKNHIENLENLELHPTFMTNSGLLVLVQKVKTLVQKVQCCICL